MLAHVLLIVGFSCFGCGCFVLGALWASLPRDTDVPPPAPEWSPDALERAMASDDVVKVRAVRSAAGSRWN